MTTIITIALLILAYLFTVGLTEFFKADKWRIKTLLSHGIPKWAIVLLFIAMAPLVIGYGGKVCWWRVKRWWAIKRGKRAARRIIRKIGKNHKDNPELQKALKDSEDVIKKL